MPVEVERKFVCDSHILEKLKDIGAVCMGQYEFKDQYFDSADFTLTLKNFWLRKREGSWELKRPPSSHLNAEKRAQDVCTNYREITDLLQIRAELMAIVGIHTEHTSDSSQTEQAKDVHAEFEKWLQDLKLECFAEFTTVRCSYTLEDEGDNRRVRIDLDQADFGYCVGEIEVLVSEGVEMTSALHSIEKTAQKLGLGGEQKTRGKMEVYLQKFRPDHYAELLKAHIL
ncbi:thiamine-triphosphatase [Pangasianodon hypophthalmus]|uniref:thiamine-triphosphatase n=1 Tax=Pangasianodon hypophthalmus TaxID=310915 RepID=UPI002306E17C|nr:thiamine-triphosphatase [Pangasianodon hypophthalmus]